jgi:hypothetical protein
VIALEQQKTAEFRKHGDEASSKSILTSDKAKEMATAQIQQMGKVLESNESLKHQIKGSVSKFDLK